MKTPFNDNNLKAFIYAIVCNMAIMSIWYTLEYKQFHELQWGRARDTIVNIIYLLILWYMFSTKFNNKKG